MTAYEFLQCENCDFLSNDEFDEMRRSLDEDDYDNDDSDGDEE